MSTSKMNRFKRKPLRAKAVALPDVDPGIAAEDQEIRRLEKLLGLSNKKSRKSAEAKLNAEYSKEGIGEDFGSFLFELDDLSNRIVPGESETLDSVRKDESHDFDESQSHSFSDSLNINDEEEPPKRRQKDLYGESLASSHKYMPPAKRNRTEVDEKEALIRRRVTGLVNKLAEGNKDSIFRELVEVYGSNSHILTTASVTENILQNLKSSVQKLSTNCLLYASMMSALHVAVGVDTTSYFMETIFNSFRDAIIDAITSSDFNTKYAHNLLIVICAMYDLRVLHHRMITDLLRHFCQESNILMATINPSQISSSAFLRLEFIEIIVYHCGEFLKADEPSLFQALLEQITPLSFSGDVNHDLEFRQKFLLESLTKVRSGPVKNNSFTSAVRLARKWLGGIKNSVSSRKSDALLNLSLSDLLNAETSGRWWKIGASWRTNHSPEEAPQSSKLSSSEVSITTGNDLVDKAASKLKLSGGNKKSIFRVLMNCRDVMDAFESLLRLDLKGKGDRDIIRVLCECCCQEIPYNPFYAEISKLFCNHSRQAKITFQYVIWDAIKSFRCSDNANVSKHTVNLARMAAELVATFNLPLIFLKIFSPVDLLAADITFLTVFFTSLFLAKSDENSLREIVDRIATSKDFISVRDLMLLFLQVHYKRNILPSDRVDELRKKKRWITRQLNDMKVLDMQF